MIHKFSNYISIQLQGTRILIFHQKVNEFSLSFTKGGHFFAKQLEKKGKSRFCINDANYRFSDQDTQANAC